MSMFENSRRGMALLAALMLLGVSVAAKAAPVTEELFKTTTLVTATSMNLTEFNLSSPGTLLIKLEDLKWPGLLDTLSFTLTDATKALQTFKLDTGATSGNWSFNVTGPQTLYGAIFAKPTASSKAGMYYADVSFQAATTPVPLPAAIWLLISGVAGLAAFRPAQRQKL